MVAKKDCQRVALWLWDLIVSFCNSPPLNCPLGNLTSNAHVCFPPALTATAIFPIPRSSEGRFIPISARGEQKQKSEPVGQTRKMW